MTLTIEIKSAIRKLKSKIATTPSSSSSASSVPSISPDVTSNSKHKTSKTRKASERPELGEYVSVYTQDAEMSKISVLPDDTSPPSTPDMAEAVNKMAVVVAETTNTAVKAAAKALTEHGPLKQSMYYTSVYGLVLISMLLVVASTRFFLNDIIHTAMESTHRVAIFFIVLLTTIIVCVCHYFGLLRHRSRRTQLIYWFVAVGDICILFAVSEAKFHTRYLGPIILCISVAVGLFVVLAIVSVACPSNRSRHLFMIVVFVASGLLAIFVFVYLPYKEYWTRLLDWRNLDLNSIPTQDAKDRLVYTAGAFIFGIIVFKNLLDINDVLTDRNIIYGATYVFCNVMITLIVLSMPGWSLQTIDTITEIRDGSTGAPASIL